MSIPNTTPPIASFFKREPRESRKSPGPGCAPREKGVFSTLRTVTIHRTWQNPSFHDLIERGIRWASGKGKVYDSRGRVAAGLAPFSYEDSGADIPNYLPGRRWGTVGEAHRQMQKPLPADESIKHLVVPPGFEPRLFAAEPEIYKPLCMAWDHRGTALDRRERRLSQHQATRRPGPRSDRNLGRHQR